MSEDVPNINLYTLAREIAEKILFSQVRDIENLTVWEMTSDHVTYDAHEKVKELYSQEEQYEKLCDTVYEELDKAIVGITWDGGETWQW